MPDINIAEVAKSSTFDMGPVSKKRSASLVIDSDDPDESDYKVNLGGYEI